ncbi:MAG: hypothetical protein GY913_22540 [Proteobacteria bacterium]|nr:hypothetical protein [Pseudomonadota bacterium]MCP4919689.1 hypothetical protein [Pseudomonadota bacterium]
MTALVERSATELDHLRAALLRTMMRVGVLRRVFLDRAWRLFALYLGFIAIALAMSSLLPLWQLLLGPLLYGFAHLAFSVRFFHYGVAGPTQRDDAALKRRAFGFLAGAAGLYTLYRLARSGGLVPGLASRLSEWQGAVWIDVGFVAVIFLGATLLYRKSPRRLALGALVLAPLSWFLWHDPRATAGVLALAHNLVAFVYWLALARNPRDRRFALAAFAIFLAVNAAIFGGLFDPIYEHVTVRAPLGWAGLSVSSIGAIILPTATDEMTWVHATAAFAFGQSTHYYVWLKAIPDQANDHPVPTSFRRSWRLLRQDFGRRAAVALVGLVLASFAVWLLLNLEAARLVYFSFAGFHGYLEIAGLALLAFGLKTRA